MKKRWSNLGTLFLMSFVSAETSGKETGIGIRGFFGGLLSSVGQLIFGGKEVSGGLIISALFLILILFLFIHSILDILFENKNKFLSIIISLLIPIVIIMTIPEGTLFAILLPYGVMGATMLLIIPIFVLVYFSIKTKSAYFTKLVWILFAVYHIIFFFSEYSNGNVRLVYLFGGIIGVLMIFLSSRIRQWYLKEKNEMLRDSIGLRTKLRIERIKAENREMGL